MFTVAGCVPYGPSPIDPPLTSITAGGVPGGPTGAVGPEPSGARPRRHAGGKTTRAGAWNALAADFAVATVADVRLNGSTPFSTTKAWLRSSAVLSVPYTSLSVTGARIPCAASSPWPFTS